MYILADPCNVSNPCLNGAVCDSTSGSPICNCSTASGFYKGTNCGDDVDECSYVDNGKHVCLHGGVCGNTIGNYTCNCTETLYIGSHCQTGTD